MSRPVQVRPAQRVEHAPVGLGGERVHFVAGGPARRWSREVRFAGSASLPGLSRLRLVRIDPARENRLEPRIDARSAQRLLHERVEAERRQVPFVEHNRMAQRDRPLVVGVAASSRSNSARERSRLRRYQAMAASRSSISLIVSDSGPLVDAIR